MTEASAAALATGCEVKINVLENGAYDLRQNKALGTQTCYPSFSSVSLIGYPYTDQELTSIVTYYGGTTDYEYGIKNASTDFVSHVLHVVVRTTETNFREALPTVIDALESI